MKDRLLGIATVSLLVFSLAFWAGVEYKYATVATTADVTTDDTGGVEPMTYCWRGTSTYQDCLKSCMWGEYDEDPPHQYHTALELREECLGYHCPQCVGRQGPQNRDCPPCAELGVPGESPIDVAQVSR